MLRELIELWPGGPTLTLGHYFIAFKYLFSIAWIGWAIAVALRPARAVLLGGPVVLALLSFLALDRPLGRPYGLVEGERTLAELGDATVVVARGSVEEGRHVRERNSAPGWGVALAALTGLEPARVLDRSRVAPALVLLLLALAVTWSWSASELENGARLPRGSLPALVAVFVLFLSSHRLSFLAAGGAFWPSYLWGAPHVGASLAAVAAGLRWLAGRSYRSILGGGLALAVASWLELRVGIVFAVAAALWLVLSGARRWRWVRAAAIALSALAVVPFHPGPAAVVLPPEMGTWHDAVNRVLSVTLDFGLLFVLAVLGAAVSFRARSDRARLAAAGAGLALALFAAAASGVSAARVIDPRVADASARFFLSVCAGLGLHHTLGWIAGRLPDLLRASDGIPSWMRSMPAERLALSGFLVLSLPWCFPYWWEPVRMDSTYVASVPAVSRRYLAMADAIRERTSPEAVFAAGPTYAPWIAALSGRRVLLDESGPSVPLDAGARRYATEWFLLSHDPARIQAAADEWGLTHLAWGRLDQPAIEDEDEDLVDFSFFERSPRFEETYRLRRWVRVYEYVREPR